MEDQIVYLKLVNGDELFGKLISEIEDGYLLEDVMIMESVAEGDSMVKYMFMTRYTPYSNLHSISIFKKHVITMNDVNDVVLTHYRNSLAYAVAIADAKFLEGIAEASTYLDAIVNHKESSDNIDEQFVADSSSTKH